MLHRLKHCCLWYEFITRDSTHSILSHIKFVMSQVQVKPAVNQCGFSIMGHFGPAWGRNDATVAMCKRHNITYEAYSPLGGWALGGTGRVLKDPTVVAVGKAHNNSSAQVALKWVVQQGIVAVTGSNSRAYDDADLNIWDFELSEHEMQQLSELR